jgi:hypothetical protein
MFLDGIPAATLPPAARSLKTAFALSKYIRDIVGGWGNSFG